MLQPKIHAITAALLLTYAAALQAATYWADDFETDKGWVFSGNAQQTWVRGTPAGGNGVGPDPVGAYQGIYCLGNNMASFTDYAYAASESSFAVSPAINCTGAGLVYVHFYRWLCTKGSSNTACSLAVSNNGAAWTGIWGNSNPAIDDVAWQSVSYDISSVASNQATVYLRFRLKDSGAAPPRHGGWNIDNILVDNNPLAVNLSYFTGAVRSDAVELSWRTESETACYQWHIERSDRLAEGYAVIGTATGHGTSSDPRIYRYADISLDADGIYYYRLGEVDLSGSKTYHGPVKVVYNKHGIAAFQAGPACPNPSGGVSSISYQLPLPGKVRLVVYNILGQCVKILFDGDQQAAGYTVPWDGRDDRGGQTAGGVYLYKLEYQDAARVTGRQCIVRKLVITR